MKKLFKFSLLLTLACVVFVSCKDDDDAGGTNVDYSILPKRAQNFVSQHFGAMSAGEVYMLTKSGSLYFEQYYDESLKSEPNFWGYRVYLAKGKKIVSDTYDAITGEALFTGTYDVRIDFDKEGTWQIIEGNGNKLPESILLQYMPDISMYVEENYPNAGISRYDRGFYGLKLSLKDGPVLSFALTGELLGSNRTWEELPEAARQTLTEYFEPLQSERNIFESGEGNAKIYTAKYKNGFQARFDVTGNWLTIKGDTLTQRLPATITAILPEQALNLMTTYLQGDITSISRANTVSSINVSQVYLGTDRKPITITSLFDAEGNWMVLEDIISGLSAGITDLLPENAKNMLAQYYKGKSDFRSIKKIRQKFGLEMIDLIAVGCKDAATYTFYADGRWFSFDGGTVPPSIEIVGTKVQDFVRNYFSAKTLRKINKDARVSTIAATADTTVTYLTYVTFTDNSWLTFYDANDEWCQVVANGLTNADGDKILSDLLPFESSMYLSITLGSMDPKPLLNKVENENVVITTNTGTVEEPVLVVNQYPCYRISYIGGAWARFNIPNGDLRTVQAATNTTPLPQAVKDLLPTDLLTYIAAKGWDINAVDVSYVNKLSDTLYELRFLQDGAQTFVRYDLTIDPNLPEEEPA